MEYQIETTPENLVLLEEFLHKMKIRFTKNTEKSMAVAEEKSPYNQEFVEKIKQGEKDLAEGKTRKLDLDNLWK